jgi:formylglycine-generating enzyme required for sulfatase activity
LAVALLLLGLPAGAQIQAQMQSINIPLWEKGQVPLAKGDGPLDGPFLTAFLPPEGKRNGSAVIIAPGGSNIMLMYGVEGIEVAERFNRWGTAAFVLTYRLSPRYDDAARTLDGLRAMRVLRARAKEFGVDPNRVLFAGFSAGSSLARLVAAAAGPGNPQANDPVERAASKPNQLLMVYSAGRPTPGEDLKNFPPTFLLAAAHDRGAANGSAQLFLEMNKAGTVVELHLYQQGRHGFGAATTSPEYGPWMDELKHFLQLGGFFDRTPKAPPVVTRAAEPKIPYPAKLPKAIDEGYGEFLLVPAGPFAMGDNFGDGEAREKPVHTVELDTFYMSKFEVTNEQWNRFRNDPGYDDPKMWPEGRVMPKDQIPYWTQANNHGGGTPGNEKYPVIGVNWDAATAYCNWLSAKTGKRYRLPTEAEWEKAARGTDQRRFPWGNEIDHGWANFTGAQKFDTVMPVGYYNGEKYGDRTTGNGASPYGLMDMAGNLMEWCSDWYSETYYSVSPKKNPQGPATGAYRVLRGGAFFFEAQDLRSYARSAGWPSLQSWRMIGFRPVREP